ncbi:MAG: methyltransferase domain-containing protein [Actinomycetota bacterium]|nr:methyltransferase domain-containing protein [Actinomycetota bacterium]
MADGHDETRTAPTRGVAAGERGTSAAPGAAGPLLEAEIGFRLSRLVRTLRAEWSRELADLEITPPEAAVLRAVAERPGSSLRALARLLGAEPMTAKRCVDELEQRGLLSSAHRGEDRRPRALELTGAGASLAARVHALVASRDARLAAALGERGRHAFEIAVGALEEHVARTSREHGGGEPSDERPATRAERPCGPRWDGDHRTGATWDERFASRPWPTEPDPCLVELASGLRPGRALDLGCGPGRNAIWLARQGWAVTAVDASAVGLSQAASRAAELGVSFTPVQADLLSYDLDASTAEIVVVANLHLLPAERGAFFARACAAVAPGGHLLVVGHHVDSLGRTGPTNPERLYTEEILHELLASLPATIWRREHAGLEGEPPVVDVVAWATAPSEGESTR